MEQLDKEYLFGLTNEELGQVVRETWVKFHQKQPNPKPKYLDSWKTIKMSQPNQVEVDILIGQAVAEKIATKIMAIIQSLYESEYLDKYLNLKPSNPDANALRIDLLFDIICADEICTRETRRVIATKLRQEAYNNLSEDVKAQVQIDAIHF